ncbi:hypothetical protein GCM10010964_21600 [Caldovatus sediminis]|uniref:Uncharacterized protein n=1 Tax=Caldovatus sediminis TaxID=2041189 RepID=A0A8J2ZB91_9PROT|nr:hypothetical protein GCM10010964_21600 [Caldovatus sediminis]
MAAAAALRAGPLPERAGRRLGRMAARLPDLPAGVLFFALYEILTLFRTARELMAAAEDVIRVPFG